MNGQRPVVSSLHGMVAAAHPLAAFAGARILRAGGNAFDAAVTTAVTLGIVEPFMSGLAGLGMATCYSAQDDAVRCLDFVPGVPGAFDTSATTKQDIFVGAKASGVPGNLAGWAKLAATYGKLPFATLLEPAIELAEDGFPVTDGVAMMTPQWWDLRSTEAEWVRVYTNGSADIPLGWILRQPDLADSLRQIATDGPDRFYRGPLGERVVEHLQARGGYLSMADLDRVEPQWIDPVQIDYRGLRIHTLPPPAEAFQCLLTLGILGATDIGSLQRNGAEHLDAVFRAVRIAAQERITHNRADAQTIAAMLGDAGLGELRNRHLAGEGMSGRVQQWQTITDPQLLSRREHTTSLSTADAEGNMVCLTQSLGSIYGSGVVVPDTGICMNNFLNWTDLDPASPNALRPGEPLGMCLAPTISTRADVPVLALGTPGSYGILHTQVQALVQYCDFGLALQPAIEAPRARLWDGRLIHIESRVADDVLAQLRSRGHDVRAVDPWTLKVGGMQAIERDPDSGRLTGAADPRRDGYAAAP
jgi:gamma-glutamyltranspeptidase/glutathione hydrolase